jgi:L-arabinonolactonase
MSAITLVSSIPCANILGEGVQWNPKDQSIYWLDIIAAKLFRYQLASQDLQQWYLPERPGCFAFAKHEPRLLMALASGFAWFDLNSGECEWIAKPEAHIVGNRANDGRCDRQGRFWMGSIVDERQSSAQVAGLYCLDHNLQVTQHLSDLSISNALCWSPDGDKLYHADSPARTIHQYNFDCLSGQLSNRQVFAQTPEGIDPDGACVDAQGNLWNAQWGGSHVMCYASDGRQLHRLPTPASQTTCCAFGGENLDLLLVTSARVGLSDAQLSEQPQAGNLFIYQTQTQGLPENWFGS